MTRLRYSHNTRDANEAELVGLAARLGGAWREDGPLDGWIFVPRLARWMPVEIKRPEREGLADEYTKGQRQFIAWAKAHGAPWWVWRTSEDVLRDLGAR